MNRMAGVELIIIDSLNKFVDIGAIYDTTNVS